MSIDQLLAAADALAMAQAGLTFLAQSPAPGQEAETLIGLERMEAQLTAARARVLAGFCAAHGYEADGQFGAKPWLRAFTRITRGAANGAMAWERRLTGHPAVAGALAGGTISASWAREICAWTSQLPPEHVEDADAILLAAADGGADLADLAQLAWEMIERARTSPDADDGAFADRAVGLETTLDGAGHLIGDLTPACAAAVNTVLDALAKKAGPEDTRSLAQRRHDALDEVWRWLELFIMPRAMELTQGDGADAQLRAGVYARLSETYDAAESVPTQLAKGTAHAERRGWRVAATFKDDGYSGFKEITRDDFVRLIRAIDAGEIDVVIVRDIDRLTRNLTDWNQFEKVCVRHGVRLSPYTGGELDLSNRIFWYRLKSCQS